MIKPNNSVKKASQYAYPIPFMEIVNKYKIPINKILKLDYNEPTISPSPMVKKVLKEFIEKGEVQYYPSGGCLELRKIISKYTGTDYENIIVGNGSDEILKIIAFSFLSQQDNVVVPVPNYPMFIIDAELAGAFIKKVSCNDKLKFQIEKIIDAIDCKTKAVYISNPNSPIGFVFSREELINLLERCRNVLIVIDEAYFEFYGISVCDLIDKFENLIVVRTFSKAFCIAGLRLGYCISNKQIISTLNKMRDPESVNILAQIAGISALKDIDYYKKYIMEVKESRQYLFSGLNKMGLITYPSYGNFILVRFPSTINVKKFLAKLEGKGIYLRDKTDDLKNCVRIGIPLLDDSRKLLDEIKLLMTDSESELE